LIEELPVPPPSGPFEPEQTEAENIEIVILPYLGEGDEMVGAILARLLKAEGLKTELVSSRALRTERLEHVKQLQPKQIVLSAIQSGSIKTIDRMIRAIQHLSPHSIISVCLWSLPREGAARWIRRIREASHAVYTGTDEAVRNIALTNNTAAEVEQK
jgi:hypothetical protein